jgi:nicotinate phosphoribosyltransferase
LQYIRLKMPYAEPDFFDYLKQFNCKDITLQAIPEGTVVFPKLPLIIVEGPLAVCQFLETTLLNLVNFASLVTTNAARFRLVSFKPSLEFAAKNDQKFFRPPAQKLNCLSFDCAGHRGPTVDW